MPRRSARNIAKATKTQENPSTSSKTETHGKPSASRKTCSRRSVTPAQIPHEWYFLDMHNTWIKYGYKDSLNVTNASIVSEDIEKAYLDDPFGVLYFHTQLFHYILKFDTMEQMNLTTKTVRPVHRRPMRKRGRSAAEDEYLPNLTASKYTITHIKIESVIEMFKVLAEVGKVVCDISNKSKVNEHESIETKDIPKHARTLWLFPNFWDPMKDDETMALVPLESTNQEYQDVMSQFTATQGIANTVIIKRVQNPYILIPYEIRQKELSIKYGARTQLNIQKLFHGTKEEHVISICKENFDWRLHGINGKESFGMGTYFSNSARLSQDYSTPNVNGHRFMFLAEVIVGTIAQGNSSMTRPPRDLTTGESYDTTVDNVADPHKFVKYDKQDYCPLYVIEFW